jgi:hypothetical protein
VTDFRSRRTAKSRGTQWTARRAITGGVWAGALRRGRAALTPRVRAQPRASSATAAHAALPSGDSKTWRQLNAVERQAAEWLGYDEKRWEVSLN